MEEKAKWQIRLQGVLQLCDFFGLGPDSPVHPLRVREFGLGKNLIC